MVPSRRVCLHTPLPKGFSCAFISTSSGSDVCIFPSASQGCLVRLNSQLGKHPPFPCSAPQLRQAPALHWQSILYRKSDRLRHPVQGKRRDQPSSENKQPSHSRWGHPEPAAAPRAHSRNSGAFGAVSETGVKGCQLYLTFLKLLVFGL